VQYWGITLKETEESPLSIPITSRAPKTCMRLLKDMKGPESTDVIRSLIFKEILQKTTRVQHKYAATYAVKTHAHTRRFNILLTKPALPSAMFSFFSQNKT